MRKLLAALSLLSLLVLCACSTTAPEGVTPVTPFDLARYQGQWFEIARLDHSFERGLSDVIARYRALPDGSIEVINRGYDAQREQWREAAGHAKLIGEANRGSLKVSFFGPFYAGYHVAALDQQDYRWAMVAGPDHNYLWLLAREKSLSPETRKLLLDKAKLLGFETDKLIWVTHTR